MGTKWEGTAEEILALDTYIKFVRSFDAMKGRIEGQHTTGDLSGSQFGTLEMLYHLGPLTQKDIGQKLLISKSNVVTVIDKLEERGFVRRQRCQEDRRHVFVHLTENGRQEIEVILPIHVGAITEEMNRLSPQEQQEFGRLCRKLGRGQ
jgi:MarR family 2-MHQ and catechol resistance regulon transcriptional repressor